MKREGPYREQGDIQKTIEHLRQEIAQESKIGIQLPENIKEGDVLEQLTKLEQYGFKKGEGREKYEDIILYSLNLGILRLNKFLPHQFKKYQDFLYWQNEDQTKSLVISIDNKKKEAAVISVETQT